MMSTGTGGRPVWAAGPKTALNVSTAATESTLRVNLVRADKRSSRSRCPTPTSGYAMVMSSMPARAISSASSSVATSTPTAPACIWRLATRGDFVRFDHGPERHPVGPTKRRHFLDIALQDIEVDDGDRRFQLLQQHAVLPVSVLVFTHLVVVACKYGDCYASSGRIPAAAAVFPQGRRAVRLSAGYKKGNRTRWRSGSAGEAQRKTRHMRVAVPGLMLRRVRDFAGRRWLSEDDASGPKMFGSRWWSTRVP